jgi:hypothetical protein
MNQWGIAFNFINNNLKMLYFLCISILQTIHKSFIKLKEACIHFKRAPQILFSLIDSYFSWKLNWKAALICKSGFQLQILSRKFKVQFWKRKGKLRS